MMMLLSSPPASKASAALMAMVIVTGFSKVLSVDKSNALPVAVKSVGSAGISATERGT